VIRIATSVIITIAGLALATTVTIPYTGGKQSGVLTIGYPNSNPAFSDTVVLDEGLSLSLYWANIDTRHDSGLVVDYCVYPVHYGLNIRISSGVAGSGASQDTAWVQATSFPETMDTLPFIPASGFIPAHPIGDGARGRLVGTEELPAMCAGKKFSTSKGYNRLIYFRLSKPGGFRYGKLMVAGVTQDPTVLLGAKVRSISVAYAITGNQDIDVGPVSIMPSRALSASMQRKGLVWSKTEGLMLRNARGALYNLRGERLHGSRTPLISP
jgi:hypothetical protein